MADSDPAEAVVFRRACEELPGAVWLRPHDMSRISYVNAELESVFGVERSALYGDPDAYLEAIHPNDRSAYDEFLEDVRDRALDEGVAERTSIEYRIRDGRTTRNAVETVFPVTNGEGALLSWGGLVRDLTDERSREAVLELQTDQLELLNQVVRHDIRNEVNLGLDILRSARRQGSIDEENLERIEEILGHVAELTETARDMTEMITTLSDEPDPIRLAPTLKREIANISTVSEAATIEVSGAIPDVEVRVNELLSAVFRNLLTNAIQHSDTDTPEITVSCTPLAGHVAVHIADNGPGIPDEKKEIVFESGETLVGSTGTGFGLPLVETLLEQYGGDIYLSDNEPRGSVFTVVLPLNESDA